jgi:hypothetical protein
MKRLIGKKNQERADNQKKSEKDSWIKKNNEKTYCKEKPGKSKQSKKIMKRKLD